MTAHTDPRLHCAKCNQPLKIVCDAHGTEFVPEARMLGDHPRYVHPSLAHARIARRIAKPLTPRAEPLRDRMVRAMRNGDPSITWSTGDLARMFAITNTHVSVEINGLLKAQRLVRVARNAYRLAP